jgi:hypothetical protein
MKGAIMGERRAPVIGLCVASALVGGVIGGWMGQTGAGRAQDGTAAPKILGAEELRLVDSTGRVRAALEFSASGQPALTLRDENNVARVSLSISDETGVAVRDVDGKSRLVLSVDQGGVPSLIVRDRDHHTNAFRPVKAHQ